MGILLFLLARLMQWILTPVFFIYAIIRLHNIKKISDYFHNVALSIDQLGNTMGGPIMNDVLIMDGGHKFGNPDETISKVIGLNYPLTLSWWGYALALLLNKIDPNHVQDAAISDQ
jgi:hypothetical protein